MPIMDGFEATARIKAAPGGRDTVVIALTASAFEEDREKVFQHGADDFVRKPFREHEIFEMLSKHLGIAFVYEEMKPDEEIKPVMTDTQIRRAIADLPVNLKENFYSAVERVDFDDAVARLKEIEKTNAPLDGVLSEPVHGYRFDYLQPLFEQLRDG